LLDKDEIWLLCCFNIPHNALYIHIPLSFCKRKELVQIYFSAFLTDTHFILFLFVLFLTLSFPRSFFSIFLLVSDHSFSLLLNFISHNIVVILAPFPFSDILIIVSPKFIFSKEPMQDFCVVRKLEYQFCITSVSMRYDLALRGKVRLHFFYFYVIICRSTFEIHTAR
jgi:hypothetical protein